MSSKTPSFITDFNKNAKKKEEVRKTLNIISEEKTDIIKHALKHNLHTATDLLNNCNY